MITDNRSVHADCLKAILIQCVVIPNRLSDFDSKDLWKPTMFYTNNLQYSVFFAQLVFWITLWLNRPLPFGITPCICMCFSPVMTAFNLSQSRVHCTTKSNRDRTSALLLCCQKLSKANKWNKKTKQIQADKNCLLLQAIFEKTFRLSAGISICMVCN